MNLTLLVLVQWLHILSGIAWFGGYIFVDFVLWPALLRLPAEQARATYDLIGIIASQIMAASGMLVILMGIVRGTVFGPIRSIGFLFGSAYGLTWALALVIAIGMAAWGATWHDRWLGPVWEGEQLRPGIASRIRTCTILEMSCFGIILACMVLMSVGL